MAGVIMVFDMCEVYLKASDLISILDLELKNNPDPDKKEALAWLFRRIVPMKGADVRENIRAHWQRSECRSLLDGKGVYFWYCSNCRTVGNGTDDYCGKCGAFMKVPLYEGCD